MKRVFALAAALLVAIGAPAAQAKQASGVVSIRAGAPVTIAADKAYILFRTSRFKSGEFSVQPVFLRVPGEQELAEYRAAKQAAFDKDLPKLMKHYEASHGKEPKPDIEDYGFTDKDHGNVFTVGSGTALEDAPAQRTFLVEVPAGKYVLYGLGIATAAVGTCFCLGTVSFHAEPGIVTDLGTILVAKASDTSEESELRDVTGLGKSVNFGYYLFSAAVRPATAATAAPGAIPADRRRAAGYHAVGPFLQPGAIHVNRLGPIPGVLRYDAGKVVDVKSGEVLE
jgi:hypothetical protein